MNQENVSSPGFKKVLIKDMTDRIAGTELFVSLDKSAKVGMDETKPEILANLTNCMIANRLHFQSNTPCEAKGNPLEWELVEMY